MTVLSDAVLPQVSVLGSTMAYREAGDAEAPVALFLHGNPTSSYIWRNCPSSAPHARCIAPDLLGMGDSEKAEDLNPARYAPAGSPGQCHSLASI
jgi:haloalkane dehalogenase